MKAEHYAVLRCVAQYQGICRPRGVTSAILSAMLRQAYPNINGSLNAILRVLCDRRQHPAGALIERVGQNPVRYIVVGMDDTKGAEHTGGYLVLAEARSNPHLETREKAWIARAREGEVDTTNLIAVPTGSTKTGRGRDMDPTELVRRYGACIDPTSTGPRRKCPRCNRLLARTRFGTRKNGCAAAYCRECEALRIRERRKR